MKYDDFTILEKLSEGGNATVYLGETPSHFKCAIKS